MLYIAICDDDEKSAVDLKDKVSFYIKSIHELAKITLYSQSTMLQYDISEGKHFDLILSDIEMPDIDGMELAEYMKQYLPEVLIIFITSHLKYAVDAYELSIFRYIPKDTLDDRLERALTDAIHMIKLQSDKFYKIDMPSRIEKIPYREILYIRREGKYAVFYLLDGTKTFPILY